MDLKIISDLKNLDKINLSGVKLRLLPYRRNKNKVLRIFKYLILSYRYDYLLLNYSSEIFLFGLLKWILPFNRCKFVTLDIFLPTSSKTFYENINKYLRIIALKKINIIFLYSKRNEEICKTYKIRHDKTQYIPFKINNYDYVINQKPTDRGYIFTGGVSRRDYPTLIEAVRDLKYPLKIITPSLEKAIPHGTYTEFKNLPENVELIHDDGSVKSFISYIANSRIVVIPLKREDFASTGRSVYLVSMALKKCVIISSGPATNEVLTNKQAIIVPPEDISALRRAIIKAFNDGEFRNSIAVNGNKYALGLGDHLALCKRLLKKIVDDFSKENVK